MHDLIDHLRILEDAILTLAIFTATCYLFYAAYRLRKIPMYKLPLTIGVGFVPLFLWKLIGSFMRIAIHGIISPETEQILYYVREVFESLSGLVLALSFLYVYILLQNYEYVISDKRD
ncbi:MAG: hypothetical protein KAH86_08505 [Methanosarcinales archaeon]|nr:hypothetical protein [Methanosarcinales archaeon]